MAGLFGKLTRSLFKTITVTVLAGLVVVAVVGFFLFQSTIKGLPEVSKLKNFRHELSTEVFSDDNRKIGEFTTERRYPVRFETIPKHSLQAFLAAEDSKFYEHGGVDFGGVARAILSNTLRGRFAQGGSTITQQVARIILLETRKKEITRKVKEMVLAFRMEKELTKNEILGLYLSEIYLGHGAYGIGAAALNYFNKKVQDLSIAESAMLAGLPQRPNEWDPFRNPHLAKRRQLYVIKRMVDEKFITKEQGDQARAEPLKLYTLEELNDKVAPYFTEYVRQYLMKKYGSENILSQGFKVYTTVRYDFQKQAEKSLDIGLRQVDKRLGWRGVASKLAKKEEIEAHLADVHEKTMAKLTRVRILPGDADQQTAATKRLLYDLSFFQQKDSPFFGPTPVAEGEYYSAVVTEIEDERGLARARVGETTVLIPISTMDWVQVDKKPIKKISQVLAPGDVISVKVGKIDRSESLVLASLEQEPEVQGALLCYDIANGKVRAMVGGRDFVESKFNRALHAKRQVGSTFKPLLYAAAIDKGFSPSSLVTDAPLVFKFEGKLDADSTGEDWRPKNYSGKYEGDIPLRLALIRSMNIPTVKLLNEITIDYGIEYARALGITATLPRDLSIGLGSWSSSLEEISRAYAIFPRLGRPLELHYITKVEDAEGKIVEEMNPNEVPVVPQVAEGKKGSVISPELARQGLVISPQTAYVMTDMLKGVVREGTGHGAASVPAVIAGKTGTSNDHRDAWFVGFTPDVITGVWIGYDKDKPLDPHETGGVAAAPIWADFMQSVVKNYSRGDFTIPDEIVFAYVDRDTGKLSGPHDPHRVRVAFKVGTVPNRNGDNIPRIGDPGVRATTTTATPEAGTPSAPTTDGPIEKQEETSDFIREGYQE